MGLDVLLINPKFRGKFNGAPNNLLHLAGYLRKKNQSVALIDLCATHQNYSQLQRQISSLAPLVIGLTSHSPSHYDCIELAKKIKESFPKTIIVKGGYHETLVPDVTLKHHSCIDITVRGDGEIPLSRIVDSIKNKSDLADIPGISFRDRDCEIVHTSIQPDFVHIDYAPSPARDLLPASRYHDFAIFHGKKTAQVLTARGCPYSCTFCHPGDYRSRSIDSVINEIEGLIREGVQAIFFDDSVLTLNQDRTERLCGALSSLDIEWACQTRVDLVRDSILQMMREAGCTYIYYGIESGSKRQLNTMNKDITDSQIIRAVRRTKESGIRAAASVIFGLPDESDEDVETTFTLLRYAKPDYVSISAYALYPGTKDWTRFEMDNEAYELSHSREPIWRNFDEGVGSIHLMSAERASDILHRFRETAISEGITLL